MKDGTSRSAKPRAKIDLDTDKEQQASVICLSSGDDDEANADLSAEIVKRAKHRVAKMESGECWTQTNGTGGGQFSVPVIELCSSSPSDVRDGRMAEAVTRTIKRKKKRQKKKIRQDAKINDNAIAAVVSGGMEMVASETRRVFGTITRVDALCSEVVAAGAKSIGPVEDTVRAEKSSITAEAVIKEAFDTVDNGIKERGGLLEVHDSEGIEVSDNAVLRRLLRGPRYFDPPESLCSACYNCGKDGHLAASCPSKKWKPCFVCGNYGHNVKNCTQIQDCFICKKRGHQSKSCPVKDKGGCDSKICLRCGASGHDMSSCKSDYAPEDLMEIQCYVCQKYGHLCCAAVEDNNPRNVACYNCGQKGHSGSGCAKLRGAQKAVSPMLCYKCGVSGHFARGCSNSAKSAKKSGWLTPKNAVAKKARDGDNVGYRSEPAYLGKPWKKKMKIYEGRNGPGAEISKTRDGWITHGRDHFSIERNMNMNSWQYSAMHCQYTPYPMARWQSHFHSPHPQHRFYARSSGSPGWANSFSNPFAAARIWK